MDPVMIVLRSFHIIGGVLWVGAAFLFVRFIGPTAADMGPAAGPFLSGLVRQHNAARFITSVAIVTVIAGWLMWGIDMSKFGGFSQWIGSSFGLVLTLGGILATIAAVEGSLGVGANAEKLVDLGDEVRASGAPPTPEQGARLQKLGAEIARHGKIDIVLVLGAVFLMATARYW